MQYINWHSWFYFLVWEIHERAGCACDGKQQDNSHRRLSQLFLKKAAPPRFNRDGAAQNQCIRNKNQEVGTSDTVFRMRETIL